MNINIDICDIGSIKKAIDRLKYVQRKLKTDIRIQFLLACCAWVQSRANEYLEHSDIGEEIKNEIKASWVINETLNTAILTNTNEHAVYVEFGVGGVGGRHPHPNSISEGYEYDVPSNAKFRSKRGENFWTFKVGSAEEVDMHRGYLIKNAKDGNYWVTTKGSVGVMYVYNAIMDLITIPQNLRVLWYEVLAKNLG